MLTELFSTPEGLMSLAVIVFMIGMGGYLGHMFIKKMNESDE